MALGPGDVTNGVHIVFHYIFILCLIIFHFIGIIVVLLHHLLVLHFLRLDRKIPPPAIGKVVIYFIDSHAAFRDRDLIERLASELIQLFLNVLQCAHTLGLHYGIFATILSSFLDNLMHVLMAIK